jgi:putative transcriptional regulator
MKSFFRTVGTMFTSDKSAATRPNIALNPSAVAAPHVIDASAGVGYLAGQLLVATPVIDTGCFQKSVIYVFAHSAEGAMGIIINQPLELVNYASLVEGMDLPNDVAPKELPVYFGGPVERARGFVIHSTDYQRNLALMTSGEIAVTASSTILQDMALGRGPRHAALVVGYAGWTPGQLEAEIEANSWITVPATPELVFGTENELKWATASQSLGIDMAFFSTTVGHA